MSETAGIRREDPPRVTPRAAGLLALLLALGGVAAVLWGLSLVPADCFFSGDNALKYRMARQWAAGADLPRIPPPAPAWARAMWSDGAAPYAKPFAIGEGSQLTYAFPLAFAVIAGTIAAGFGAWSLRLVPLLFLLIGWWAWWLALQRLRLSPGARLAWLGAGIFACPSIVYGTLFWEHAVALGWMHVAMALLHSPQPRHDSAPAPLRWWLGPMAAALSLAAVGWIRPEGFVLGGVLLGLRLAVLRRPARALALGVFITAMLAWLLSNRLIYGLWTGAHGAQWSEPATASTVAQRAATLLGLARQQMPTWSLIVVAPLGLWLLGSRLRLTLCSPSLLALLGFGGALPWLMPNDGGLQWAPRYALVASPVLLHLGARAWEAVAALPPRTRSILSLFGIAALAYGSWLQIGRGIPTVAGIAEQQCGACRTLRGLPVGAVAATDQLQAQLVLNCAPAEVVLVARSDGLAPLLERCGSSCRRIAWVLPSSRKRPPQTFSLGGSIFCALADTHGIANVVICARSPQDLSGPARVP